MKKLKSLGAALSLTLFVLACDASSPVAPAVRSGVIGWTGPLPLPGDGLTEAEQFQVCKYGSSASFSYTVTDNLVATTSTINVAAGECWVIAAKGGAGVTVSITETSAQAGYALDRVELETSKGDHPAVVQSVVTSSGPTVSGVVGGNITGLLGVTARFYNTAIPATGSIGDFVWNDLNGNGVQDTGEPGLAGVTVSLGGAAFATTTTDANGAYLFSGLAAGIYTVTVATPAGYSASPSGQGGDPLKDSNGSQASVTLATYSSSDLSIDFGFVLIPPPPPSGQIGDFVWKDTNGNGIQDLGEAGFAGLIVTLVGPVGTTTTTTDASGNYLFTGLPAGSYTVSLATPTGYTASQAAQGSDPNRDSNGSPTTVTLPTDWTVDLSIDFGFSVVVPPPTGGQGCTPGYWKQSQHFDSWPAAYAPDQAFSSVFEDAFPGKSLVQVLGLGGGGLNALGRHTVAALLNGANSSVNANLSAQQVINAFNMVFPGGNYEGQKNIFAGFNEQGCPLN